jgi:hypothetical protein
LRRGADPGFVDLNSELVVARCREDKAGICGPSPKGVGVDTFDAQERDIGAVGDAGHFKTRVGLKGGDDFLGCGDGLGVSLGEALEEMERDGSEGPHVAESVAEHAARLKQILEEAPGAGEDGSAGCVEVLVHGDVYGIEQSGVFAHWNTTIGGGEIEPGAIKVETDLAFTGPLGNALHFSEVEGLPSFAPDRGFDLDGTDGDSDTAGSATVGFALEVVDREGGFGSRERDKIEAAEGLTAIAAIVEQVALVLNHYAALLTGEKADGEVVGERAGGEPHGGLLAEGGRHGLFEPGDHSSARIIIRLDGRGDLLQEHGVFRGRVVYTVAVGLDRGRARGGGGGCGGEDRGGEECSAVHMSPRVSCSDVGEARPSAN